MENKKIKCRNFDLSTERCIQCDLLYDKKCDRKFDFDSPRKYARVERRDCNVCWNECPTCGWTIGFCPEIKNFRCDRCGQVISWK